MNNVRIKIRLDLIPRSQLAVETQKNQSNFCYGSPLTAIHSAITSDESLSFPFLIEKLYDGTRRHNSLSFNKTYYELFEKIMNYNEDDKA